MIVNQKKSTKNSPFFYLQLGNVHQTYTVWITKVLWERQAGPPFTDREAEAQRKEITHLRTEIELRLQVRLLLPLCQTLLCKADFQSVGWSKVMQTRPISSAFAGEEALSERWRNDSISKRARKTNRFYLLWLSLASRKDVSGQTQIQQPFLSHKLIGEQYWINRDLFEHKARKVDWQRWLFGEKESWCL